MKMRVPKGCSGCSFNGTEYEADDRGVVDVPAEAAADLTAHGFTVGVEAPAKQDNLKGGGK